MSGRGWAGSVSNDQEMDYDRAYTLVSRFVLNNSSPAPSQEIARAMVVIGEGLEAAKHSWLRAEDEPCTCWHARDVHARRIAECGVQDCGCDEWWPAEEPTG